MDLKVDQVNTDPIQAFVDDLKNIKYWEL